MRSIKDMKEPRAGRSSVRMVEVSDEAGHTHKGDMTELLGHAECDFIHRELGREAFKDY